MADAGIPYSGPIDADGKLHRVHDDDDKEGTKDAFYLVHVDDHPAGIFGSNKKFGNTHKFTWSAKGAAPITAADRQRMAADRKARQAAAAINEAAAHERASERSQAMWDAAAEAIDHPYLVRKGVPGYDVRVGDFVRELRPGANGEPRVQRVPNAILIKLRETGKKIWSLQAIYAEPIKLGEDTRPKEFVYGGRKAGLWHSIGKPNVVADQKTIVICEGYATGASIHTATDLAVIVAFDAGNLIPVAKRMRALLPDARIVIAADNDQWTTRPMVNPGMTRAAEAAEAIDGILVAPLFRSVDTKPTDFNDLHALEGLDVVRRQVLRAISPDLVEPEPNPEPEPEYEPDIQGEYLPPEPAREWEGTSDIQALDGEAFFKILGFNGDHIYIFQKKKKTITVRRETDWSVNGLLSIADLNYWERVAPGAKGGINKDFAANAILRTSESCGVFDMNRIRGRGAWHDDGRSVFHFGNRLSVDGVMTDVAKVDSTYVYEQGRRLRAPADEIMSAADGNLILAAARAFHWTKPSSAVLLAGWCALAPLCGALKWRPHIWVTGGTGSGKAQPHSAKVLTPSGWRTMGDLRVGDDVTTPDGGYAKVQTVHPQGVQPTYKLTFSDGRVTRATGDHIWKVRLKGAWRLRTTEQALAILNGGKHAADALAIQLIDPVEVAGNNKGDLPIHPYALGAFLGDGYLANPDGGDGSRHDSIKITSYDPEIIERIREVLPPHIGLFDRNSVPHEFRLGDLARYGRETRKLVKELRLLGKRSADKFIPRQYLDASIENRVQLLKGLMDTDGTIGECGSLSYCTVSTQLRDDVVYLVRSLGGAAKVGIKHPTYTLHGEKLNGKTAYIVNIRLPDRAMAFNLTRKLERAMQYYQYSDRFYLSIDAIEPDAEEVCSCITIDHPDRLYITDDFVVTHNSTILNGYLEFLLNGYAIFAQGNSTEPGIRQTLKSDALPVVFDESEQNSEKEVERVQPILSLARQSSTESTAKVLKGTQSGAAMDFQIRSMFCLASIQVGIKQQADYNRMSILALESSTSENAAANWAAIQAAIAPLKADPALPSRLIRRSLHLLPTTMLNIQVFSQAAAEQFGNQRDGDQYGTMLAGAWSLFKTTVATLDEARAMIQRHNWDEYRENTETAESDQALNTLKGRHVRIPRGQEVTIFEVIRRAAGLESPGCDINVQDADALLRRYGIMLKWRGPRISLNADVLFANRSTALDDLMAKTPYASDLKGQLLRVPGARRHDPERFNGSPSRSVAIPLSYVIEGGADPEPGLDLDDDVAF